jgi:hypothetical protein
MLFQRINRSDPERVYVVAKWSWSTASSAANQWCAWDSITDQDGIGVTKASGNMRNSVAGVAVEVIANGDYGLIQVWGYRNGARCTGGSGQASNIAAGSYLYIKTAAFAAYGLHTVASTVTIPTWRLDKIGVAFAPANTAAKYSSATTWVGKVFITCL